MKNYELMCVFNTKENHYADGVQSTREKLLALGCQIEKEDDIGSRSLAYLLGKEARGHYHLFTIKSAADIFTKLDDQLKLQTQLMRHLLICKTTRPVKPPRVPRQRSAPTSTTTSPSAAPRPASQEV